MSRHSPLQSSGPTCPSSSRSTRPTSSVRMSGRASWAQCTARYVLASHTYHFVATLTSITLHSCLISAGTRKWGGVGKRSVPSSRSPTRSSPKPTKCATRRCDTADIVLFSAQSVLTLPFTVATGVRGARYSRGGARQGSHCLQLLRRTGTE